MESMLEFPQYFRAHKSHLVNLNHVDRYIRGQGGYLVLKDGTQIPVARTQKSDLMQMLKM
jgi:two-component system LytT family response regulator